MEIRGARFVVADQSEEHGNFGPERLKGTPVRIGLQVEDPDQVFELAVQAGASIIYAVADQDYGYRLGHLSDPFGHHWEVFKPI
ncbi:VOC family protein [Dyadobacter sp. NIV53]|uniref:VOC family protein n=1 Tax=Dyadobacter sp. NIV53 TaxID=2861765 RepID=UPI001C86F081|nr:VOC family protein [Dyadobacter sp. NIV53]